jgi:hypothetical protein
MLNKILDKGLGKVTTSGGQQLKNSKYIIIKIIKLMVYTYTGILKKVSICSRTPYYIETE